MNKCHGKILILLMVLVLYATLFFSVEGRAQEELVPLYTPPVGGTAYTLGAGIVSVTNKHLGRVRLVHESTTGTMDMVRRMAQRDGARKSAFAIFGAPDAWKAFNGRAEYTGKPLSGLRAVVFVNASDTYLVVPAKSAIRSYADVKGKKIGIGGPGGTVANSALIVLQYHGVKKSDFRPFFFNYRQTIAALRKGSLDGGFLSGGYPVAIYKELAEENDVRIVPVDERALGRLSKDYPYYSKSIVKAGSYKGIEQDVATYSFASVLWTLSVASDDVVYRVLRNLFEHRDDYYSSHQSAKDMTIEHAAKGIPVPLHPGASRYLKEIGALK